MFKKQVYVKPLEDGNWGVFEWTFIEEFFDDWKRFGFGVAWGNLQIEFVFWKMKG